MIVSAVLDREDIVKLQNVMRDMAETHGVSTFARDAGNLDGVHTALLLGTRLEPLGLKVCGLCGFGDCAGCREAGGRCAFNTGDLGIALGSAAAVAADRHADNRIMYTMGMAALRDGWLGPEVKVAYGIPLSATGKNPFFDRK